MTDEVQASSLGLCSFKGVTERIEVMAVRLAEDGSASGKEGEDENEEGEHLVLVCALLRASLRGSRSWLSGKQRTAAQVARREGMRWERRGLQFEMFRVSRRH